MVLVNVSILPHGAMLLDLSMPDLPEGVAELNNACFLAGQNLVDSSPETIILFTPHGLSIQTKPAIYLNKGASGKAGWNGHWETYSACAECDCPVSGELLGFLNTSEEAGAAGITSFSRICDAPLAWGEVVPLQFVSSSLHSGTKVVVCGWPQRRHKPVAYAKTAFAIGQRLQEFAVHHPKRIALLFSCDLSHVHGASPDLAEVFRGDPELGVNKPLAEQFDAQILSWVGHLLVGEHRAAKEVLLSQDTLGIVEQAKSCGWAGFCAVQGALQAHAEYKNSLSGSPACVENSGDIAFVPVVHAKPVEGDAVDGSATEATATLSPHPSPPPSAPPAEVPMHWEGKLWGYGAPTYYGMMAVTFSIYEL